MRLYKLILFLTLVVSGHAAKAAPTFEHQPDFIEMSPKGPSEPIYSSPRTERDWSLRLGFLGGTLSETNKAAQIYLVGLRYDFLKDDISTWQMEASVGKENFVHLVLGKKWAFPLEQVTKPYYKFAIGDLVESTDGLGSVFNFKKMQAIAAVGLDDLFHWDQRLQGEISLGYALVGPQLEMSLGISF